MKGPSIIILPNDGFRALRNYTIFILSYTQNLGLHRRLQKVSEPFHSIVSLPHMQLRYLAKNISSTESTVRRTAGKLGY